ncbi:MAG: competence/damage-inducible protein A, partial [Myxococcota bacterium]
MGSLPIRIESVAVGDELLDGRISDGNTRFLGDSLAPLGLSVARATCVPDDVDAIAEAILEAATRADVVVTSGGLGPTTDDLTAAGVARAAGCGLRLDEPAFRAICARFEARGLNMPENNRRQAELPSLGEAIGNDVGVAPGFVTPVGGAQVYSLPGVPREYRWMVEHRILPLLVQRLGARGHVERRTLRCLGITESALGAALEPLQRAHPDVLVQYRTSFPENHARFVVVGDHHTAVSKRADMLLQEARSLIGGAVYGEGDAPLEQRVVAALLHRGATV